MTFDELLDRYTPGISREARVLAEEVNTWTPRHAQALELVVAAEELDLRLDADAEEIEDIYRAARELQSGTFQFAEATLPAMRPKQVWRALRDVVLVNRVLANRSLLT